MGTHLHTLSLDMDRQFAAASQEPEKQGPFLTSFGHRGPGELELSKPRWAEMGPAAFPKVSPSVVNPANVNPFDLKLSSHIVDKYSTQPLDQLPGVYGTLVRQEWELLHQMLELREGWKNELLRTYAEIRWVCLELGKRFNLGSGIFWLRLHEINKLLRSTESRSVPIALKLIEKRSKRSQALSRISLPTSFSMREIETLLLAKESVGENQYKGEGLSSGIAYGEIRVVTAPEDTDVSTWPNNVILVAQATDPGWTPLFLKAKAIIVEKGGVLSHCAIVARELGLPVVSGILGCHFKFKEGEHVWVDGSTGTIRKA